MRNGGKRGNQETSGEGGAKADLGAGSGDMTKTKEGEVVTTDPNGIPWGAELSVSADRAHVGCDGWRCEGRTTCVDHGPGAPPRPPGLPRYRSPSSWENQPPLSVGNRPEPQGPDSPEIHTATCQSLADRKLQKRRLAPHFKAGRLCGNSRSRAPSEAGLQPRAQPCGAAPPAPASPLP